MRASFTAIKYRFFYFLAPLIFQRNVNAYLIRRICGRFNLDNHPFSYFEALYSTN